MIYVGIDPGLTGAICVLEYGVPNFVQIEDLAALVIEERIIGIETQTYSPRQKGAGTNMKNYGIQLGHLQAYSLEYQEISPLTWYKTFKIKSGMEYKERKKLTATKVGSLYPLATPLFYGPKGGLLDGRTDALAVAHHMKVTYESL